MAAQDAITIVLDNASVHKTVITSVTDGDTVVIADAIPAGRHADVTAVVKSYNGFMCKVEDQRKFFRVTDAPLLPQTMITESASPENIQPEREIQISQVDWRKGFQDFLLEDFRKYYESENCDARMKGKVMLAPKKLAAISFGSALTPTPALLNGGLETWTVATIPDNWTETGGGVSKEETVFHGGSKAAKSTNATASTMYQDIAWDNAYKGKPFAVTAWLRRQHVNSTAELTIDDGVGTSTQAMTVAANTWQQVGVGRVLDTNATRLRIKVSFDAAPDGVGQFAVYMDDFSFYYPVLGVPSKKQIEVGDNIVGAMGNSLYAVTSSVAWIGAFPTTITDLCLFQDRLYVGQGWSYAFWYTDDLQTYYLSLATGNTAKFMSNIGNTQFWIADTNNTMRDSDNPINGGTAFSSQYTIGSDDFDITGLVDHDEIVFVRKEDDLYYLSVGDVLSLLDLDTEATVTYTYGLHRWGDNLYVGSGVNSLYEYDISSGTATVISPVRYAPGDENYDEELLAICSDETYLYIALDNGSDIKILAGRWEEVAGETDWYWHPIYDKTMNDIQSMFISALTGSKRLYLATDTYADGIFPCFVPLAYSCPYLESGYECEAEGTFITPWFTSNFPTEEKYWKSIDITSICITAKTSITPYYQVKGGSWVAMTALTTSALNGSAYPDEVTDNRVIGISSERIRFKFVMAAAVDEYTPIIYGQGGGFVAYSVLQSDRKRQIEATLVIAATTRERGRAALARTVSTDLTDLRALYTGNDKETIVAPDDTEYNVVFAREGYEEQLAYDDVLKLEVWWVSLRLLEV
jgi:hypothetical protein